MLHATSRLYLLMIEGLHCRTRKFRAFCCSGLDLDRDSMTFKYELTRIIWTLEISLHTKINFLHHGFRKLSYYTLHIHTYRHTHTGFSDGKMH